MTEVFDKRIYSCIEWDMDPCCYCSESSKFPPDPNACLINKMRISIKYHGFRPFLAKCKPIIEFAGDNVVRYLIKCVEYHYPEEADKLQSLLVLL
jgi:hypothetical protein